MTGKSWYYLDAASQQIGPHTGAEIMALKDQGILRADSRLWKEGMVDWIALGVLESQLASEGAQSVLELGAQRYCPFCGGKTSANVARCAVCGESVPDHGASTASPAVEEMRAGRLSGTSSGKKSIRFAFLGIVALGLAASIFFTLAEDTRTVDRLARSLLKALEAGDLVTLRNREELGMNERMDTAVLRAGGEELSRRRDLRRKAIVAGEEKFREATEAAWSEGLQRLRSLSSAEQKRIENRGLALYRAKEGYAQVAQRERELIPNFEVLADLLQKRPDERNWILSLGILMYADNERPAAKTLVDLITSGTFADVATDEQRTMKYDLESRGNQRYEELRSTVIRQGDHVLDQLDSSEQKGIRDSYAIWWIYNEGQSAVASELKSAFPTVSHYFVEESSDEAKRTLGMNSLSSQERQDVAEILAVPGLVEGLAAPVAVFVETHGVRIVTAELKEAFGVKGGYKISRVSYYGRQARSLLRNSVAVVELDPDFTPESVKKTEDAAEQDDAAGKNPEEDQADNLAAKWLDSWVLFRSERGQWKVLSDASDAQAISFLRATVATNSLGSILANVETDADAGGAEARLQALNLSAGISFVSPEMLVLVALIALALVVVRRNPWKFGDIDYTLIGLVVAIAAGQHLLEGQINLDDWFATPVFLAAVTVYGAYAGALRGAVISGLSSLILYGGAVLFHLPYPLADVYATAPLGEFVLLGATVAVIGGAAGRFGKDSPWCGLLPLIWIVSGALIQRDSLLFPGSYGYVFAGAVVASILLMLLGHMKVSISRA